MSAYICNDDTMVHIMNYLRLAAKMGPDHRHVQHVIDEFAEVTGGCSSLVTATGLQTLGDKLRAANQDSVNQRYNEQAEAPVFTYLPKDVSPPTAIQAYKSIQCLAYQCAEGDVPERPIYKLLIALEDALAHEIVQGLDAYEKAVWG